MRVLAARTRQGLSGLGLLMLGLLAAPPQGQAQEDCNIDLESGSWSSLTDLPIRRHENATAKLEIGGSEYIFYFGQRTNGVVLRYDIDGDSWASSDDAGTAGAPPLKPHDFNPPLRGDHKKALTIGDKIYIIGGTRPFDSSVWTYDGINPAVQLGNIGCSGAALSCAGQLKVGAFAAAFIDGEIYTAGGHCNTTGTDSANCTCNGVVGGTEGSCAGNLTAPGENTDRAFRYNPVGDDWFPIADMPIAVDHASGATYGGKFYVFGGRQCGTDTACEGRTHTQIYDPGTDMWSFGAALPEGCSGMGHAAVMGDRIYVIGGEGGACSKRAVQEYDPIDDSWRTLTKLGDSHHGMTPIVVGEPGDGIPDRILLGSGSPNSSGQHMHQFEFTCEPPCVDCATCSSDGDCDDGIFCNGTETCSGDTCQNGTAACPGQICNEADDTCQDCLLDADCDDGLFCNGPESCQTGSCTEGTVPDCSDGVGCTIDSCNEAADTCSNSPNDAACDDGLFCNGTESCDAVSDCQAGTAPDCSDGVGCTTDSCNEAADTCSNSPNDAACDDGLFCNGTESCDAVSDCQAGTAPDCSDGVGCTTDSCNEAADACSNSPNDAACDDGLFCNGKESCDATNDCIAGQAPELDDGVACTIDECDEMLTVVTHVASGALCDDGLFCNGVETCDPTDDCISGSAPSVDDGIDCTVDSCDEVNDAILHQPVDNLCDDGAFCNGVETCDAALDCQAGSFPCADAVACTIDGCDEATDACSHDPSDSNCADDLVCNGDELCDPTLGCMAGTELDCGAMDSLCATYSCDEATGGCLAAASNEGESCEDGNACTLEDTCVAGACERISYCGVPLSRGAVPTVSDALFALQSSVGLNTCPVCECDVNSSGDTTVADALTILSRAVDLDVPLSCFLSQPEAEQ